MVYDKVYLKKSDHNTKDLDSFDCLMKVRQYREVPDGSPEARPGSASTPVRTTSFTQKNLLKGTKFAHQAEAVSMSSEAE